MTKTIAVVGSEDFTLGFQLAGVREAHAFHDQEERQRKIDAILDADDVGILVVHQEDVNALPARTKRKLTASLDPVVITLGGEGAGDLREQVKRAIGIDLYKD